MSHLVAGKAVVSGLSVPSDDLLPLTYVASCGRPQTHIACGCWPHLVAGHASCHILAMSHIVAGHASNVTRAAIAEAQGPHLLEVIRSNCMDVMARRSGQVCVNSAASTMARVQVELRQVLIPEPSEL